MADLEPQQTDHLLGGSFPRSVPSQRYNYALRDVGVGSYRDLPPFAKVFIFCT